MGGKINGGDFFHVEIVMSLTFHEFNIFAIPVQSDKLIENAIIKSGPL